MLLALVGVGALAAGALVVVVILAAGGSKDNTPTLATPAQLVSTAPVDPTPTVTTIIRERARTASVKKQPDVPAPTGGAAAPQRVRRPISNALDRARIRAVVAEHWSNIESGDYAAAYSLLGPRLQTGESGWTAAHAEDALTSASIEVGRPVFSSSTSATVPVIRLRTEAQSGCFNWSGSYGMLKVGGNWRINRSGIDRTPC